MDQCSWLGVYVGHSTIHSGNLVLVYNPLTCHTTPQFHVVFDDHFQTVAPHLVRSSHTEVDNIFDQLWTHAQWHYDGNIPPEYLFDELTDLPTKANDPPLPNMSLTDQLAPDHLVDIIIDPMCPNLLQGSSQLHYGPPLVPPGPTTHLSVEETQRSPISFMNNSGANFEPPAVHPDSPPGDTNAPPSS